MKKFILILIVLIFIFFSQCNNRIDNNTIRIHLQNYLFFTNNSGKAIVLTGSHTWMRKRAENNQWISDGWNLKKFRKYLDFLEYWNHNYIRLWMWEQEGTIDIWVKEPNGKYDLSKHNQAYFDLVKSFVAEAESRDFFVGVMLFQGWSGCCEAATPDHPIKGVSTNPHYDPQRKSLGDIQLFAAKVDRAQMIPVTDPDICSTTFCLMNKDAECLAYQPQVDGNITIHLAPGNYEVETFDTVDSSSEISTIRWNGGDKTFTKPAHISEDWIILISVKF